MVSKLCSQGSDWLRVGRYFPGFEYRKGQVLFFSSPEPTQFPIQMVLRYFPRVKRSGREANHSPSSSAKVCSSCTPTRRGEGQFNLSRVTQGIFR